MLVMPGLRGPIAPALRQGVARSRYFCAAHTDARLQRVVGIHCAPQSPARAGCASIAGACWAAPATGRIVLPLVSPGSPAMVVMVPPPGVVLLPPAMVPAAAMPTAAMPVMWTVPSMMPRRPPAMVAVSIPPMPIAPAHRLVAGLRGRHAGHRRHAGAQQQRIAQIQAAIRVLAGGQAQRGRRQHNHQTLAHRLCPTGRAP